MILLFMACTSFVLVLPSWGGLTPAEFNARYDAACFPKTTVLVNGQENPLSQTLENFIALAEKLEVANPNMRLKDELFFFVRNFIYENVEYTTTGDILQWKPTGISDGIIKYYWEPETGIRNRDPMVTIPYDQGENCSIFHMLSHSIMPKPREVKEIQRSSTNNTRAHSMEASYYPMEIGVVAIRGTEAAVALGKVLTGMYVGLNPQRKRDITQEREKSEIPEKLLEEKLVDPLYTLTLAETISVAKWRADHNKRDNFTINGEWQAFPELPDFETKHVCPTIYKLPEGTKSTQSYSTLRGAADGLILGSVIQSIMSDKDEVKLSEILRMYYSRGGITTKLAGDVIQTTEVWASFCDRENILNQFDETIRKQVQLYYLLTSEIYDKIEDDTNIAMNYYNSQKTEAYSLMKVGLSSYCGNGLSLEKVENLPTESPLDITAVLDTRNGDGNFRSQQLILGYFMKEMQLSYYGSRMTILTDQKITSSSSAASGTVSLKPILEDTYSSPCAACLATQIILDDTIRATESEVIIGIDQLLQAKKDDEIKRNGVKGKVVIYFNFKEEPMSSRVDQEYVRVDRALRDLHLRHRDVEMYAIGRSKSLVQRYSKNDITFALEQNNPEEVAKELFKRVSRDPAILQYTDCEKATSESGAYYENLVSRNAIQHWFMPAKYLYKSKNWKFNFESTYGSIKVCYFQGSRSPENQADNCKEGNKLEFKNSNPCKGLTMESCSPFNFAVIGINNTENGNSGNAVCKDTTELKCKSMDQIKFRVTHDGIRCSGAIGLTVSVSLLIGVFLLHIKSILNRY